MRQLPNNISDFFYRATQEMVEAGVKVKFVGKYKYSGTFSDEPLEFVCKISKEDPRWFHTFIHEYCHFLQWREQKIWNENVGCDSALDMWLSGVNIANKKIEESIETLKRIEIDCEKRVVKLIKSENLSIDIEDYIRRANSYVLFYNVVREERLWYKKPPYNVDELVALMPSNFLKSYDHVPRRFAALVKQHCF